MSGCCGQCETCPANTHVEALRNEGTEDWAVVYETPSIGSGKRKNLIKGPQGGAISLVNATLEAAGLDIAQAYVCTAVNCDVNTKKKPMMNKAMNGCRDRLIEELQAVGVNKVLCLGPMGFGALLGHERVPAITKARGRWHEAHGMSVLATLPPTYVLGERNYFPDFAFDLNKFATEDGPEDEPDVELWIPDSVAELEEAMKWVTEQDTVSCDTETTGLSPISSKLLALGIGVLSNEDPRDGTTLIIDEVLLTRKKTWRLLGKMLSNPDQELVFHNAKFDLQFFKTYLLDKGFPYEPQNIHDTMLLHYAIDERPMGRWGSHSLKNLARQYFDAHDYDIHMGKFLKIWNTASAYDRRALREDLHTYLGLDCYYTARLFPELWNAVLDDDEQLMEMYDTLLMPGSLALAEVEHRGILLDTEMYEREAEELGADAVKLQAKLQKETGRPDFNPGSPKQVQEVIYEDLDLPFGIETVDGKVYHTARRGGLQEGPTAAPVLKGLAYRFPEHKELIDDICEYRNLTKNIGTYLHGLLQRVDTDGKIRCSFNLHGTATGRLSSSNPNLQNIPDASHTGIEIRGGFMARPGYKLIEADYKQLEVRIAAWLADDDQMKSVFTTGRDPHQEIAFSIYRKPKKEITHYMRWLAKNILFGLLYGRGYESVATGPEQEDIAARGGQRWSIDDVKEFYSSLLAEWADFAAWQENQRALGYAQGFVQTPTGRKKRFSFIPRNDGGYVGRASFNNPIQGTASDFTLYALIQLHERLPEGAHIVSTVHDALIFEVRDDLIEEVVELIRTVMEEETLFEIDVPLKVDIDISQRWGEVDQLAHVPIVETENGDD